MKKTRTELEQHLQQHGISYQAHEHLAVYTVEEAQQQCAHIPGCHCKNLFLKTKKKQLWLVVLEDNTKIDLKALAQLVGVKAWSFASPDRLMEHLGVEPGSVTPFALINDSDNHVNLAVERKILTANSANFHPLVNNATLNITPEGLRAFLDSTGHSPLEIDC
jgi:Ala-tRNA(Pro) deacylase